MKRKLKRWIVLGLASLLLVGGCGRTEEFAVEEAPENVIEAVEEQENFSEIEIIPLRVSVETIVRNHTLEGNENAVMSLEYCDVSVEGDGYENLKRAVENWSLERGEELRSIYASLEETVKAELQYEEEFYGDSIWQSVTTKRADSTVLSLSEESYQGSQGQFYKEGWNFDAATGKKLVLADILSDAQSFTDAAKKRTVEELQKEYSEDVSADFLMLTEKSWETMADTGWYLDASGIVLLLEDYTEGPYELRDVEIHLPYEDFRPYMKENYLPKNGDGVLSFDVNQEIFVTLPESGKEISLMLYREWDENEIDAIQYIQLGESKKTLDSYVSIRDLYLVRNGQKLLCMVEVDVASDDFVTTIYDLSGGRIQQIAEIGASVDSGNINIHEVQMEFAIDLLGTYTGVKTYQITETGELQTEDTEYILHRNETVLTTTVDLPVVLEGGESTLPAGSHIILTVTDGETYAKFVIQETGQTGVISVERDSEEYYHFRVNGMDEWECFEMLPYAG